MSNNWETNSTNKTANFALNQWELDDKPQMEDFNYDNEQIDQALHGLDQSISGAVQAVTALSTEKASMAEVNEALNQKTAEIDTALARKADRVHASAVYSNGVFKLTTTGALPSRYTLSFTAPADLSTGDTMTLNNTAMSLVAVGSGGNPPLSGAFSQGDLVTVEVEGGTAFFKSGGGSGNAGGTVILPSQTQITVSSSNAAAIVALVPDTGAYFAGTLLVVKQGSTPQDTQDGLTFDAGTSTQATITGLQNNSEYYVRAFAYNQNRQYQTDMSGAVRAVTPAAPIPVPTYTGSMQVTEHEPDKFYAKLLSSGTLSFNVPTTLDAFLVGGGGGGATSYNVNTYSGGGGGGYTKNVFAVAVAAPIQVNIGTGGAGGVFNVVHKGGDGGSTSFGTHSALGGYGGNYRANDPGDGGNGGSGGGSGGSTSGGNGGSNGAKGTPGAPSFAAAGTGQATTTKPFGGDRAPFSSMSFAGGGGGGGKSTKGLGGDGGGNGCQYISGYTSVQATNGTANTGGGGGGGNSYYSSNGGSGGSGIVIIRWGNWS